MHQPQASQTHASEPQAPQPPVPAHQAGSNAPSGRGSTVYLFIIVVAVIFVTLVGIIYYKSCWDRPPLATVVLIVRGTDQMDGADVIVEALAASGVQPRADRITKAQGLACAFHVPPGVYRVAVYKKPAGATTNPAPPDRGSPHSRPAAADLIEEITTDALRPRTRWIWQPGAAGAKTPPKPTR